MSLNTSIRKPTSKCFLALGLAMAIDIDNAGGRVQGPARAKEELRSGSGLDRSTASEPEIAR